MVEQQKVKWNDDDPLMSVDLYAEYNKRWNLFEKERESIEKERTEIILIAEKEKLSFENEKLNNDQFT